MTTRRRLVRVPASSANLGPGYDVLAAALALQIELEVEETGEFSVEAEGLDVPRDRSNLIVRAFESLHPADQIGFRISSEVPLSAGLGSSAAAIVAGLLAADHLYELALEPTDVLVRAAEIEGHPDNVAAALYGGFVLCSQGREGLTATRLDPPQGVEGVLVIPNDQQVPTNQAREAIPAEVPHADAVANVAAASELVLGIERSDLALIERGLADRLHQPQRAHLYPRSMEVLDCCVRARRARRHDLGRGADRACLVLLAEHRQGGRRAQAARRRLGRGSARTIQRDGRRRPAAVAMGESPLSLWSEDSVLSIASKGSALSIGSVGSFASIGSVGSGASAFSVASVASFGSTMSAASAFSVMSAGQVEAVMGEPDARAAAISAGALAIVAVCVGAWAFGALRSG